MKMVLNVESTSANKPDATQAVGSTHAWADVYLSGAGWITFDPANGAVGAGNLIRVAVGREITQVLPTSGCFQGVPDDRLGMDVAVILSRIM